MNRNKMRVFCWTLALALAAPLAVAGDSTPLRNWGLYATGGTTGVGLGLVKYLNDSWSLRADVTGGWSLEREKYRAAGLVYQNASIDLQGTGVYADYRPWQGNWRLVAGVQLRAPELRASSGFAPGAEVRVGDQVYSASALGAIEFHAEYPDTMPYIGIGWGFKPRSASPWTLAVDLGAAIGQLTTSYFYTNPNGLRVQLADATKEQKEIDDALARWKAVPVLKLSIGYSF